MMRLVFGSQDGPRVEPRGAHKGVYELNGYADLVKALKRKGRYSSLDYGNPLYEGGRPPRSEEGIEAFASYAGWVSKKLRAYRVIWEVMSLT